jgi:hypothetical protein
VGKHLVGKLPVGGSQLAVEGTLAEGGSLAVGGTQGRPPVVGGTLPLQGTEVQKLQARRISKAVCESYDIIGCLEQAWIKGSIVIMMYFGTCS